jgi:hypothetical protein
MKLQDYDGDTKIFTEDDLLDNEEDSEEKEKPDDYGFVKVRECEEKMLDDFNEQLENDEDLGPVLKKIDKLADELEGKNGNSTEDEQ